MVSLRTKQEVQRLTVSITAVSGVLIREERGEQKPIFYVSKTLLDVETRYPLMENLALAVVMSARKLRPHFQSHTIVVLTSFLLRTILHSPSQSGRLTKWAVDLSEYDIEYRAKSCAKSQVLADFLVEIPTRCTTNQEPDSTWTLHVDGSSSKQGTEIGIQLTSPTEEVLEKSFLLIVLASNNKYEYESLIAGLRLARGLKIRNIHAYCDSQLVANQYNREYEARDERMDAYLKVVWDLTQSFDQIILTRISRAKNAQADALAALASSSDPGLSKVIPMEFIEHPSIGPPIVVNLIDPQDDDAEKIDTQPGKEHEKIEYGFNKPWMQTILSYIADKTLPTEKWVAQKIKAQLARYILVEGELYKWRFSGNPYDLRRRRESAKDNGKNSLWILWKPLRRKIPHSQN
ncbi:hypothetical protein N665_0052s0003 [Sinapis alba]|nr:hypothetical protein N665_0052s0003 [Sinapis alba]